MDLLLNTLGIDQQEWKDAFISGWLGRSNSTNPKSEFSPKRWLMDGFGLLAASEALGLALARRPLFYLYI